MDRFILLTVWAMLTPLFVNPCCSEYMTSPIKPLYECDHQDQAIPMYNWYASCKKACSPFSTIFYLSIKLYRDPREATKVNVYQIHNIRNQVSSHTDIFNNCNHLHSTSTKEVKPEDMMHITKLVKEAEQTSPSNTTIIIETPIKPDCSYFIDKYVSYDSIIAIKSPGKLMYDENRKGDVRVPALSSYIKSDEKWSRMGNSMVYWTFPDDVPEACPLTYLGEHRCINRSETGVIECPLIGSLYHKLESGFSLCGHMNLIYVGNGYYIDVSSSFEASSPYFDLQESSSAVTDNKISVVVGHMNQIYGSFSDSVCESVCDLSELVMSSEKTQGFVVETPLGPWMSIRVGPDTAHNIYMMSPCRRVSGWKVRQPLIICNSTKGIFIEDQMKNVELWDPKNTYFKPGQMCEEFPFSDIRKRMLEGEVIKIGFWGRSMIIHPPYNNLSGWEEDTEKLYRSSKWTPYLHGVDTNISEDIRVFLDELRDHSTQVVEIEDRIKPLTISTTLKNWAEGMWESTADKIKELSDQGILISTMFGILLKIIPIIIISLTVYYTVKLSLFIFNIGGEQEDHLYEAIPRQRARTHNFGLIGLPMPNRD